MLKPGELRAVEDAIEARYRDLLDLAAAVDPAAAVWIEGISRVPEVRSEAPAAEP